MFRNELLDKDSGELSSSSSSSGSDSSTTTTTTTSTSSSDSESDQVSKKPDGDVDRQSEQSIESKIEDIRCLHQSAHESYKTGEDIQNTSDSGDLSLSSSILSVETVSATGTETSSSTVSPPPTNEAQMDQLAKDIKNLDCLLEAQEVEWNAVLRLKKEKEHRLAQLRRQKDIAGLRVACDEELTADIRKLVEQVVNQQNTIPKMESECKSLITTTTAEKSANETSRADSEIARNRERAHKSAVDKNNPTHPDTPIYVKLRQHLTRRISVGTGLQQVLHAAPGTSASPTVLRGKRMHESSLEPPKTAKVTKINTARSSTSYSGMLTSLAHKVRPTSTATSSTVSDRVGLSGPRISILKNSHFRKVLPPTAPKVTATATTPTLPRSVGSGSGRWVMKQSPTGSFRLQQRNQPTEVGTPRSQATSPSRSETVSSLSAFLASRGSAPSEQVRPETELIAICQHCDSNPSAFVCSGCEKQSYCSRECQAGAWEHHSQTCARATSSKV